MSDLFLAPPTPIAPIVIDPNGGTIGQPPLNAAGVVAFGQTVDTVLNESDRYPTVTLDNSIFGNGIAAQSIDYIISNKGDSLTGLGDSLVGKDVDAPVIAVGLVRDTGFDKADGVTRLVDLRGAIVDKSKIVEFTASIDGKEGVSVINDLRRSGKFNLDADDLVRVNGGTIADGEHTVKLTAKDRFGNIGTKEYKFNLDTVSPQTPGVAMKSKSDSGIIGDHKTSNDVIDLFGITEANATVKVRGSDVTAKADAAGKFELKGVELDYGVNDLKLVALDTAGNKSEFTAKIERIKYDDIDEVINWNAIALRTIEQDKTNPPKASYYMAVMHAAVFDAVNAIEGGYTAYTTKTKDVDGADPDAAAAAAAYTVLSNYYTTQKADLDAAYKKAIDNIDPGSERDRGVELGIAIAQEVIAARADDGSTTAGTYTPSGNPGSWQPTSPTAVNPLLPAWGQVKTFGIETGNQFRSDAPPAIDSAKYAEEYNFTKDYGAIDSKVRTADQTEVALFWADGSGTYTPPGHWNQIAQFAATKDTARSLLDNARLFASLNIALADAGIACWDTKYFYDASRPITAITKDADRDNNPGTTLDVNWNPLIATPPFPEYSSGHSTFSGAASTILTKFFGDNYSFSSNSLGTPGVTRQFTSFKQAAAEAGMSRIYGGIHFMSANQEGINCGTQIGDYVTSKLFQQV
jgi:membrane-associated phospholipid phosphatase